MCGNLIFDLDGTLVDSMPLHARVFAEILWQHYNIDMAVSTRAYLKTAGEPLDEQFRYVIGFATSKNDIGGEELLEQFWTLVQREPAIPFPEVQAVIPQLADAGYQLFVVSGCAPRLVQHKIHSINLTNRFELLLGTDRSIPHMVKGDGHLRLIQEHLGITRTRLIDDSLVVGDAAYDMMFAAAAGLCAVGRATNNTAFELKWSGAKRLIQDLRELVQLLQKPRTTRFRPVNVVRRQLR